MKRLLLIPLLLSIFSCGSIITPGKGDKGIDRDEGKDVLTDIKRLAYNKDYSGVIKMGRSYLERDPETGVGGRIRVLVGKAELETGNPPGAGEVIEPLLKGRYSDRVKADAHLINARVNVIDGKFAEAVEDLLRSTILERNEAHVSKAERILGEIDYVPTGREIKALTSHFRGSPLMRLLLENYKKYSGMDRGFIDELFDDYYGTDSLEAAGRDSSFRIGIICPLSGKYKPLGESFMKGAYIALEEARRDGIDNIELIIGNTRASPLEAQMITRHLINEEGVDVIVGGILNSSTVAAAQVAQAEGTVIYYPVSTMERIELIGGYVFQTPVDYEREIIALAEVAVINLGVGRIAYMAADNTFNRELEILFREEVERRGSRVCVAEYYTPGSTDFKANIDRIKRYAPEALFIPADKNDLVLIMPQLSFYEFGIQLLGLSSWNSSSLIYLNGKDMSGAVFPAETARDHERDMYISAAELVNEPAERVNNFEVRGYIGTRQVIDLIASGSGKDTLRDRMFDFLNRRVHPYIEAAGNDGIPFYRIRDGSKEEFLIHRSIPYQKM